MNRTRTLHWWAYVQSGFFFLQAIIDGASISLPHGTLTECYDELGSRYQLPVYCLSSPTNLVRENADADDDDDDAKEGGENSPENTGVEMPIKLRLSSGEDVKVSLGECL